MVYFDTPATSESFGSSCNAPMLFFQNVFALLFNMTSAEHIGTDIQSTFNEFQDYLIAGNFLLPLPNLGIIAFTADPDK